MKKLFLGLALAGSVVGMVNADWEEGAIAVTQGKALPAASQQKTGAKTSITYNNGVWAETGKGKAVDLAVLAAEEGAVKARAQFDSHYQAMVALSKKIALTKAAQEASSLYSQACTEFGLALVNEWYMVRHGSSDQKALAGSVAQQTGAIFEAIAMMNSLKQK